MSGGAATIKQFIDAELIDDFTLHIAPVLLGSGVRLLEQLGPGRLKLEQSDANHSPLVTHVRYKVLTGTPG